MEGRNLKIDSNVSFSEDIGMLNEIKKSDLKVIPEAFDEIVPSSMKKSKLINYVNIFFILVVVFQLKYLIGVYYDRNESIRKKELALRDKSFQEKQAALKKQSENFTRDAKSLIEKVESILVQIYEIKKENSYIPDKFLKAKAYYESAQSNLKINKHERSSKLAIESINVSNHAVVYAEEVLNELRKKADQNFQEQEKKLEVIKKEREKARLSIDRSKEAMKKATQAEADKFASITYEEAKRALLEAAKIFNDTMETKDVSKISAVIKSAEKSEKLAIIAEEEAKKKKVSIEEETKRKAALKEALKIREEWEKSKKK